LPDTGTNGQETLGFKSPAAAAPSIGTVSVFPMKRVLVVLVIVAALAAFISWSSSSTSTAGTAPSRSRGPVLVYGDSLIEQASPYLQSTDQVSAFGGTALCDWVDNMAKAASVEQPSVMVVEFVGNDLTPCMQGYHTPDQVRAKYEADMARLKRRVENTPILWVGARPSATVGPRPSVSTRRSPGSSTPVRQCSTTARTPTRCRASPTKA
jgi:hypothetical protein